MIIFFSPSTCGFYSSAIHGEFVPGDVIAISSERHRELLAAQADGSTIVAGEDGLPTISAASLPSCLEMAAAMRAERDRLLRASDFTQMADAPISSEAKRAWQVYRQALRDLPASVTDPGSVDWPTHPSI